MKNYLTLTDQQCLELWNKAWIRCGQCTGASWAVTFVRAILAFADEMIDP